MAWALSNPFQSKQKAKKEAKAGKWKFLLGWPQPTGAKTEDAQHKRTPVPVVIPMKYLRDKTTCVGGKKIPYTRRQSQQVERATLVYDFITEEEQSHCESEMEREFMMNTDVGMDMSLPASPTSICL
ncbi:Aste57867_9066 [Aphanomyces stellatus]|uniref:Aste57867_9066 protein n=1 Tax=Aphanomyces stellatus TaxID=120398 RepID=A0A485KM25_9STRA|nr:hypothetical protein As57867_009030 [Aphanomyces stellatus]VFT85950.1 Aste57867_9066 [Aphanomyces stellatus]